MNILHLLSWFPKPDDPTLGNFCIRQINALPEDCHSIILSVYEDKNLHGKPFIDQQDNEHFTHLQIHFSAPKCKFLKKLRILQLYQSGLKYIRKHFFNPDLIHLHVAYPLGQVALLWKRLYKIPYVLTEHWTIYQPQNDALLKGRWKRLIVRIGNNASAILPVSLDLQRNMERAGIHNRFHVIYNLVQTDTFRLGAPHQDEKKQILHVSTLRDEAKNFSGILRVIERLKEIRTDFELHIIHDYDAPQFKTYVKEHHLDEFVIFEGRKTSEEVAVFFYKSDFFLLFSNFENLPCVIVESFASGVPVLSTNAGGIAEIVDDTRGRIIRIGDEDALLDQLQFMLDHARDFDREAIRAYALRTFSAEQIGGEIWDAYEEAVGR